MNGLNVHGCEMIDADGYDFAVLKYDWSRAGALVLELSVFCQGFSALEPTLANRELWSSCGL